MKELLAVDHMVQYGKTIWYMLAEGIISFPENYHDYSIFIQQVDSIQFRGWKIAIDIKGNVKLSNKLGENYGELLIKIDQSGTETIRLLSV